MAEKIRVIIQMQHTPELSMATTRAAAPSVPTLDQIAGFHIDSD